MSISARNRFEGTIQTIQKGAVYTEVILLTSHNVPVTAIITNESAQEMGLKEGEKATAIVKAGWIMLMSDPNCKISARNKHCGTIEALHQGAINTEVMINSDGLPITAIITNDSAKEMELKNGMTICAVFKAGHVLLLK